MQRRAFLKATSAAIGAACVGAAATTSGCGAKLPKAEFAAGPTSAYPPGKLTPVGGGIDAFILHDPDKGFAALSGRCTHWGCGVEEDEDAPGALKCPCHGSRFASDGALLEGPADRPLDWLLLKAEGGTLSVDPAQVVPAGTFVRVAVS
jgi:nitrite reductase/ring-hydroxylating ferredoxin subunit